MMRGLLVIALISVLVLLGCGGGSGTRGGNNALLAGTWRVIDFTIETNHGWEGWIYTPSSGLFFELSESGFTRTYHQYGADGNITADDVEADWLSKSHGGFVEVTDFLNRISGNTATYHHSCHVIESEGEYTDSEDHSFALNPDGTITAQVDDRLIFVGNWEASFINKGTLTLEKVE